jgi:hypothetical protein
MVQPEQLVQCVENVQAYDYAWPAPPDAASTRAERRGSCAGKHAALREDLEALGLTASVLFVVGPLVPEIWPDLVATAGDLLEVHECLTVETPWAGPLLVDVTWPPWAVEAGLAGTLQWDGISDMSVAVAPSQTYAIGGANVREQKEALRRRLYTNADREFRDATLAVIVRRVQVLR